jgi:hypothetical protein
MRVTLATDPGTPGWPNEDFAAFAPGAAVLLDGATQFPRDVHSGCSHGVAWFARSLGTELLARITAEPPVSLRQALAGAITSVRARHEGTCDLTGPAIPAATVTAVRLAPDGLEYLALSDSSIAADLTSAKSLIITDTRRMSPGAIARTDPEAAASAPTGTLPLAGLWAVTLLSDGATRIIDQFGLLTWPAALELIRADGPAELIRRVREAEASDPGCTRWQRSKPCDDATILRWQITD